MYWWSIELEGIFVLPLAPHWVRHSYLSKNVAIPYTCGLSLSFLISYMPHHLFCLDKCDVTTYVTPIVGSLRGGNFFAIAQTFMANWLMAFKLNW